MRRLLVVAAVVAAAVVALAIVAVVRSGGSFVWNARVREKPCSCWVKVGRGPRSLSATTRNFLKPWFFIDVRRGRVSAFYWSLKFVD